MESWSITADLRVLSQPPLRRGDDWEGDLSEVNELMLRIRLF